MGMTAVVLSNAFNDGINMVSIGNGWLQRFQKNRARTFSADIPISPFIKGFTATIFCQHTCAVKGQGYTRRYHYIHSPNNGPVTGSIPYGFHTAVNRYQGAGTGCVYGFTGTMEIQQVRYPVGYHRTGQTCC